MTDNPITIVSGLPRSGTSMMMRVLEAGGLPVLVDGVRGADDDNQRGYYELERVKALPRESAWLDEARGKAVKIISRLLPALPRGHQYRVIFMRRAIDEILRSQKVMLERRRELDETPDEKMRQLFVRHLVEVEEWLRDRADIKVLFVNYARMIAEPRGQAERVVQFLERRLELEAMAGAVEANLYRQRGVAAE